MPGPRCQVRIVSLQQRPELWLEFTHPEHPLVQLTKLPMEDLSGTAETKTLGRFAEFRKYIFAAVCWDERSGREEVVGCAKSVPFYWPDIAKAGGRVSSAILQGLPDGGFSTILALAVTQCVSRRVDSGLAPASDLEKCLPSTADEAQHWSTITSTQPCNCVSALEIAVLPQHRGTDLAVRLMRAMRGAARHSGFPALVVPLRPTRKHEFPLLNLDEYVAMRSPHSPSLPYDPWLRKHVREGARVVRVAPRSQVLEGKATEWSETAGVDLEAASAKQQGDCKTVDVLFPGCMVPLQLELVRGWGTYVEPNVWIYHSTETSM